MGQQGRKAQGARRRSPSLSYLCLEADCERSEQRGPRTTGAV